MKSIINWSAWKKIGFRFIFIFLVLEILTENFIGNIFLNSTFFNIFFENIFTKPLIWLNNQFFNFPYNPNYWNSISGTLILIRHIFYFIISVLGSLVWPLLASKAINYKKLNFCFSEILKLVLSLKVFGYGIIKVFPIQMGKPNFIDLHKTIGDLEPVYLLWVTIGYGQPYQIFLGIAEVVAAILILFRKTMVIGLLLLLPIIVNVILLNYTYIIGILDITLLLLIFNLYLLLPFFKSFYDLLIKGKSAVLTYNYYNFSNIKLKNTISNFVAIIVILSFTFKMVSAYRMHVKLKAIDASSKYSEIKTFVLGNDTLKLALGDTVRWRFWSEKMKK